MKITSKKPSPAEIEDHKRAGDEEKSAHLKEVKVDYKYNEDLVLKEVKKYIDDTYGEHYSQNKYQATEFIIDSGHGEGFCIGNILKYAQRYGKKGSAEDHRRDLMKVLHYAIIALNEHDNTATKHYLDD